MTEPVERNAARVVVIGPDDCVLLQLIQNPSTRGQWWITPGGAMEKGETLEEAAARELVEEIGLHGAELGPPIWKRRITFEWEGNTYDQRETFFVARVPERFEANPTIDAAQLAFEGITEHRWWTVDELEAADGIVVAPTRLPALLRELLTSGPPAAPVDVGI